MLRRVRADLHVHTCLSPCGDLAMSPMKIAAQAHRENIGIVAICDHNSARNVSAAARAAANEDVVIIPGMEICSREEIHVLALFETAEAALEMQKLVYDHLQGVNDADLFGLQVVATELDEVAGMEEKLLIGAADIAVGHVVRGIHRLGGMAIAAHIDRESYSVMSQLGFLPEDVQFDACELTRHTTASEARRRFGVPPAIPLVRNSDAHFLNDVGTNSCEYLLGRRTFAELRSALRSDNGRMICEMT